MGTGSKSSRRQLIRKVIPRNLTIRTAAKVAFNLKFRVPRWSQGATVKINGEEQSILVVSRAPGPKIPRTWASGDRVTVQIPMRLALAPIDLQNPKRVAVTYGPVVLVRDQEPILIPKGNDVSDWITARGPGLNLMASPSRTGLSCRSTRWAPEPPTTCTSISRAEIVARVSSPASSSSGNDESRVGTPDAVIDALQKDKEYRLIPGFIALFPSPTSVTAVLKFSSSTGLGRPENLCFERASSLSGGL